MENNKDTAMEDIVRRLELVETRHVASLQEARAMRKANRRLTWVSLAFGAGFVLMFALAAVKPAAVPDVIRAKRLEIVDDSGKPRISLKIGHDGQPELLMFDEKGWAHADLRISGQGAHMYLTDESGRARVSFGVGIGGSSVQLEDGKGNHGTFAVTAQQTELAFRDIKGKPRAALTVNTVFSDRPALELRDKDGKIIWKAPK